MKKTLRDVTCHEWAVCSILCFTNMVNYMDRFVLAGVLHQVMDTFRINNDGGGLLQTVFLLNYMFCAPVFGYLGDRFNRKWMMAAGVFIWSGSTFVGSFMQGFFWFTAFRAPIGIGQACYTIVAPTIISDYFVGDVRSKMLAFFYFAIPVGSGLGYILGAEVAKVMGVWQWSLRITPILGLLALLLIIFVLTEPIRGQSETTGSLEVTPWGSDLKHLVHNRSFMYSTAGFTCVAFAASALAWWGPNFVEKGLNLGKSEEDSFTISFTFGIITMTSGVIGLFIGSVLSQTLKRKYPYIDPVICGIGLLISAPALFTVTFLVTYDMYLMYSFLMLGQITMALNWAIVGDILLYVVVPTRRGSASGFQLLMSHLFGGAISPYIVGLSSEEIKKLLSKKYTAMPQEEIDFESLKYALVLTCIIEVIGGILFLINACYIVEDRRSVDEAIALAEK